MLANLSAVGNQAAGSSLKMYRLKKTFTTPDFPYEYDVYINFLATETIRTVADLKTFIINKGGRYYYVASYMAGYEYRNIQCLSDFDVDGDGSYIGTFLVIQRKCNITSQTWGDWSNMEVKYDANSNLIIDDSWTIEEVQ